MTAAAQAVAGARTVAEFEQWLDTSTLGACLVYAWGPSTQRRQAVWAHAAEAGREGVVRLHHRRAADGGWEYVAVRTNPPITAPRAPASPAAGDDDHPAQRILRALRRAANFSRPCPSNAELARQCGLPDAASASYRVRQLRDLGLIIVSEQGPGLPRVVRIVASGKVTVGGVA
ncbi:hypothetical protein GCM10022253_23870 [Sphingomonas endophytica]|uniref:LexA repressor DNA-binding domain-containing protein n=1 Tax=Sphingomonas endophytica TaxID=869719 RepID=A0ABR6N493_9SPHN|nr:winged helix-turn-helix domain-containing protein [Sphingomonas endophytica]MBB5725035.1 hypothetical protein [Sphingomonas endophytica]